LPGERGLGADPELRGFRPVERGGWILFLPP
jgi:hypothetical protein